MPSMKDEGREEGSLPPLGGPTESIYRSARTEDTPHPTLGVPSVRANVLPLGERGAGGQESRLGSRSSAVSMAAGLPAAPRGEAHFDNRIRGRDDS